VEMEMEIEMQKKKTTATMMEVRKWRERFI
jgi:hypothetical protein